MEGEVKEFSVLMKEEPGEVTVEVEEVEELNVEECNERHSV